MHEKDHQRHESAGQLLEDLSLREDAELFADPEHRLEFLKSLEYDDFLQIVQHVNARMRDMDPKERGNKKDAGGFLPLLATPSSAEKPAALQAGFLEIKAYVTHASDSTAEKLRGAGMAFEALLIWVHPFNDGNGRTSRFFGKFIEDGTHDIDALIDETAEIHSRQRMYKSGLRVDEWNIVKDQDLMMEPEELEEIKQATEMPVTQGIQLSIRQLLGNKEIQDRIQEKADTSVQRYQAYLARKALGQNTRVA